jgi:uncharacterized protein YraI
MILEAQVKSWLTSRYMALGFVALVLLLFLGSQIVLTKVSAQTATEPLVVINRRTANIRFGPGMNYGVLATVKKGNPLPLLGQFSNRGQIWFQVHLRGLGDYWVASWVVDINIDISAVPLVTYKGEGGTVDDGGNSTVPQRIPGSGSGGDSGSGNTGSGGGGSGGGTTTNPTQPPPPPATTPEPP